MSTIRIHDLRVEKTPHGYECQAAANVDDEIPPYSFKLFIPPGAYAEIESGFGRKFGTKDVPRLFETRIRQYLESGKGMGRNIDFGALDSREMDGLFSVMKRGRFSEALRRR